MLGYWILFTLCILLAPGYSVAHEGALDVIQTAVPLLPAALCWGVSLRLKTRRQRWSWRLLSLANLSWVASHAGWSYSEVVLGADAPVITRSIVPWAITYSLAFAGVMLRFPPGQAMTTWLDTVRDALLFTLAGAGLIWQFLLGPSLASAADPLALAVNVANPLGDMLITFALVSMVLRTPMNRIPVSSFFLLGAFMLAVVADTRYGTLVVQGAHEAGEPIGSLWKWGSALVGLAALSDLRFCSGTGPSSRLLEALNPEWPRGVRTLLPYSVLPVALLLMLQSFNPGQDRDAIIPTVSLIIALVLIVLLVLRQLVVVIQDYRLGRSLASLSQQLETQATQKTMELARRTEELAVLGEIASSLAHCQNSDEVLTTGVELACEATGAAGGAVWLLRPGGSTELVASHGLSGASLQQIDDLPQRAPALLETTACGKPSMLFQPELRFHRLPIEEFSPAVSHLFAVPLLSRGSILGMLGLLENRQVEDGILDRDLASTLGSQIGMALESTRRYEDAKSLADRDSLSGLLNHGAIFERLEQELVRARRSHEEFALVVMDIDGFKLLNDTYGHPVGDQVLRKVAAQLREEARAFDIIGRYGGDEFVAILPGCGTEGAAAYAERVRSALAAHPLAPRKGETIPTRLSFGVAVYPRHGLESHDLVSYADANLYHSKERGGDTITVEGGQGEQDQPGIRSFGVLDGLIAAIDKKDNYTRKHCEGVTAHALALARTLGLSEDALRALRVAGLLHDVGKIGIPDHILRKPGRLTEDEQAIFRQHVLLGEMIIKDVPAVSTVLAAVGSHHERADGKGYPRGLSRAEIPLLGRVLAVSDAYSAMTTDRPYRTALPTNKAMAELLHVAGTQLDPYLVEAFLSALGAPHAEAESAVDVTLSLGDGATDSRPSGLVLISR